VHGPLRNKSTRLTKRGQRHCQSIRVTGEHLPRERKADLYQRPKDQKKDKQGIQDALKPVPGHAGRSLDVKKQATEEPGHNKEDRHPESVDEAHQPVHHGTGRPLVLQRPGASVIENTVGYGCMYDEAQHHHDGPQGIQGMDAFSFGRSAQSSTYFLVEVQTKITQPSNNQPVNRKINKFLTNPAEAPACQPAGIPSVLSGMGRPEIIFLSVCLLALYLGVSRHNKAN